MQHVYSHAGSASNKCADATASLVAPGLISDQNDQRRWPGSLLSTSSMLQRAVQKRRHLRTPESRYGILSSSSSAGVAACTKVVELEVLPCVPSSCCLVQGLSQTIFPLLLFFPGHHASSCVSASRSITFPLTQRSAKSCFQGGSGRGHSRAIPHSPDSA